MPSDPTNGLIPLEIQQLVHRSLDGPLTPDEVHRLQSALAGSADTRRWYCEVVQLHADLESIKQSVDLCREVEVECEDADDQVSDLLVDTDWGWSDTVKSYVSRFPLGLAASLLALGVGLGCAVGIYAANKVYLPRSFVVLPWNWRVSNDVIARIVSTDKLEWQDSLSPETPPTQGLRAGQQIRIKSGMMHLRYRSDVDIILFGPAVFEVRSEKGGKLYSGRLSVTCSTDSAGFNIDSPVGLLQVGPGEYGFELLDEDHGSSGYVCEATVHAFSSLSPASVAAVFTPASGGPEKIHQGEAACFSHTHQPQFVALAAEDRFPLRMPFARRESFQGSSIPLGNLFDDSKSASLSAAVASDAYQASGETIDLGIAAVLDGGLDTDTLLAEDGVFFNFANVGGGGPKVRGLPGNDCYRSTHSVPIRTRGVDLTEAESTQKIEEGIGMCSNELLTFDLEELRRAGRLGDATMRFVSDRAGINDRDLDDPKARYEVAEANLVVIVSTTSQVLSVHVNGERLDCAQRNGVFSVTANDEQAPAPMRYDGRFASFDILIPQEARYLTLATTMLGGEDCDHAVFSGARLELAPARVEPSDRARRAR